MAKGDVPAQAEGEVPPWRWPEEHWRAIVNKVRAGRSLKPAEWKHGARVAVALSFDSDHESSTLRWGQSSPGKLSQGEYASRVGVPRIRKLLARHDIKASFFVPAVVAKLHPGEQRELAVAVMAELMGVFRWFSARAREIWVQPTCLHRCGGDTAEGRGHVREDQPVSIAIYLGGFVHSRCDDQKS